MIVKVEIEAGPELKKLLEELLRGIGKPEKTGEPIAKEVIEHCARIKEKIVVPTSLIKKEKPIEYRDCPLNERKELRNRGTELLKDNRPREVQTKLKEELNVHIPVKTIHTWWNTVKGGVSARLRRDENGKEKPSLILQKQSPEKRAEIKARAMELLKDNTPMEAWRKLSKEYPEIYINDGNLYHWGKALEQEEQSKPVTKKRFKNVNSKKREIREAISAGCHIRDEISAYLDKCGYKMAPGMVSQFIYQNMKGELVLESKEGVNHYYLENQKQKEPKSVQGDATPTPTTPPKKPEREEVVDPLDAGESGGEETDEEESAPADEPVFKSKINISELKHVEITTDDLMIIDDIVMCPKANMGVDATSCKSNCTSGYIAMVKCIESGIPYVRCTKAGSA